MTENCPTEGCKCRENFMIELEILRELRALAVKHTSQVASGSDASESDVKMMRLLTAHGHFEPNFVETINALLRNASLFGF